MVTYPELIAQSNFPEDVKRRARDILSSCRGGSVGEFSKWNFNTKAVQTLTTCLNFNCDINFMYLIGSYSDSRGIELIRKHVAEYIERRDEGITSSPDDIVLVAGASEGIRVGQ